jgi:tetratricopeptide (TPR) repeat protein
MSNFNSAVRLFEAGELQEAEAAFREVLQAEGHHAEARHFHAICLYRLERFEESIAGLDMLVDAHEGNADFLESRGVAYHRWGRNGEALADFEAALALEPNKGYRYACRAWIRDKMGDVAGAVADYRKAIDLDPDDDISQNNLELMEAKLGHQTKSMFRHRTAAHLSEEEIGAYREDFERRHTDMEEPGPSARPGFSDYLREMWRAIATAKGRQGLMAFFRRGFRQA